MTIFISIAYQRESIKIISYKIIIISVFTISMVTGITSFGMVSNSYAHGGEIPIVGGLCPEGHECICTPASGVFHDLTANVNIIMGCDGSEGE